MLKKRILSLSHIRRKLLFGCVLGILPLGQAWSQDTTWTGATNSNWDLVSNNWFGTWTDGRTAIFAGANQNPITVNSVSAFGISFTSGAYTLNSGTITLVSGGSSASGLVAGEIRVATGLTANINSVLAGSVGLRKNGDGTLVLSGNNTYTGGTTIAGGTLQVGNGSTTGSLGSGTASINSGTTLRYFRNDQHTLTTSFTGTGTLNFFGTGISNQSSYVLTGINNSSFAGALQVGSPGGNGARVVVNNSNQLGTGSATVNSGSQIYMQGGTYSNNFTINGIGWLEGANSLGALRMENGSTITGSVTLAGNSRIGTSSSATVSGVISGGFSLEKTQTGTLTLSGNNTYTGGTSISAGTLSVSSNSNLGSGGGLTFNGGTLQVTGTTFTSTPRTITWGTSGGGFDIASAANTFTVSQDLTSGGSLTKLGTGTLVLSGANTYTGGTNINAGTLSVGGDGNLGTGTGGLTFNGGSLRATGSFTTNRATTLNANGTIEVIGSNTLTHSAVISGAGGLTKAGTGTLVLSGANTYTGGTTLAGAAGSTVVLGNASALGASTNSLTINAGNTLNLNGQFAGGGVKVGALTGTGLITNNPAGNFGGILNVGNGNVSSTFAGTLQDGGGSKPLNLTKVGTGTLTLTGNNTHTTTNISGGILSVANSSNLGAVVDLRFDGGGGTLQITGSSPFTYGNPVSFFAPGTVEIVDPGNTITFSGFLQGSSSLTKAGPGTLVLTNTSNTYQAGTILNGGTLSVSGDLNLGIGGLTFNGGTLQTTASFTTFRGTTLNAGDGTIDVTASNTLTHSAVMSGTGGLTKAGTGTLVLSGANTYTGGTILNAGTLSVGGDGNLGTGTGGLTFNGGSLRATGTFTTNRATTLNANGTIEVIGSNTLTHSAVISGAGGLTKAGTGTLVLSGTNTYTGGTTLAGAAGSTVVLGNASALGNGNNSLTINAGNTLNLNGQFAGGGVKVGALTGTGTITNNPAANIGGFLNVGNGNVSSTFAGSLQDGGVSKPLTLYKVGTGTLTLTGNNTHGSTNILDGIISVASNSNLGPTISLAFEGGGGTLQITGSSPFTYGGPVFFDAPGTVEIVDPGNTITFSNQLMETGSLTKAGAGTLVLTNTSNNYSGGTILNGGTLSVSSNFNLGNGGLTFNGGTLQVTGTTFNNNTRSITWGTSGGGFDIASAANTFTVSQALTSGGSLTKLGAGTLVLSGANTYTGGTTLAGSSGSIVRLGNANALGNSNNSLTINAGNTLDLNGTTITVGALSGLGSVTNTSGTTASVFTVGNGNADSTFSGIIQNGAQPLALQKVGTGTLILSGNSTYTGGTTINAGAVRISADANLGSGGGGLTFNGGTLQSTVTFGTARPTLLNAPGGIFEVIGTTLTHAGNISGAGSLTKTGTGTLVLSGNNTYSGGTFLNNGFVQVNSDSRLGNTSGALTFNGGFLAATSTFSMNRDVAINAGGGTMDVPLSSSILTLNGNLSGTGTLTKSGSGSLILNGNTTAHTGNVTITGGSLRYLDNAGLPANVTNNGALLISRSATSPASTHTGVISGTGALTKAGSAALLLQGNNSYTGSTTVSAGALIINGNQSGATGDYTVNAGATIGGSGIVGKLITLNGGAISPGNPGETGILTINGGINFNANSSFRVELQGSVVGTGYDQVVLNSTTQAYVMISGVQLIGDRLGSYQANFLDSFMILKGSVQGIGTFAGMADGALFNFDGQVFQIRYNVPDNYTVNSQTGITWAGDDGFGNYGSDNGGNIVIAAVPEPGTWALILGTLSICGYVAYRRRRRTDAEDIVME